MSETTEQTVYVDELIDGAPIGTLQLRVTGICFLLAMVDGFDAQSISYVAPLLIKQFSLDPAVMGQLYSAALVGLMIGALFGSPLADRIGRKPVILASVSVMGVFSLLTASASTELELFLYRFLTGLGLGGLMPAINILTAEFSPTRRRALMMTLMFVGFPIGAIVGGLVSAALIGLLGWEIVFLVGGAVPLVAIPVIIYLLPESPRYLAQNQSRHRELVSIVAYLAGRQLDGESTRFRMREVADPVVGIRALFSGPTANITITLWILYFLNLLTLFAVGAWLPSVLNASGFPLEKAIVATLLFSIGGVIGGLLIAVAIDRVGGITSMAISFVAAAVCIGLIGQVTESLPLLVVVLFLAGVFAMGCQFGLNALTSGMYNTRSRATGLGWALAVGRVGAIVGPIITGIGLSMNLEVSFLFSLGAIPMAIAAIAVLLLGRIRKTGSNGF